MHAKMLGIGDQKLKCTVVSKTPNTDHSLPRRSCRSIRSGRCTWPTARRSRRSCRWTRCSGTANGSWARPRRWRSPGVRCTGRWGRGTSRRSTWTGPASTLPLQITRIQWFENYFWSRNWEINWTQFLNDYVTQIKFYSCKNCSNSLIE